jgi:hypothetical protein
MEYNKTLNFALVFFVLNFFIGILFAIPEKIGLCGQGDVSCIYKISEGFAQPLILGSFFLGITFLVLRFLPKRVFNLWLKFAVWYVPLAALWIIITPASGGGWAGLAPDKEGVIWLLGGIYLAVSFCLIAYKTLRLKFSR